MAGAEARTALNDGSHGSSCKLLPVALPLVLESRSPHTVDAATSLPW